MVHSLKCPYCNYENQFPGISANYAVGFAVKEDEPVITDTFSEHEHSTICESCKKKFNFMVSTKGFF